MSGGGTVFGEQDKMMNKKRKFSHPARHHVWTPWECWLMELLDFRYWFCDCHYQAPYGKVIMGGCPKHD
jgi:hypothetical protein